MIIAVCTRNLVTPAADFDGRKTRRDHWAGDTLLVGAGVGSNPTRNQIFLITCDLA